MVRTNYFRVLMVLAGSLLALGVGATAALAVTGTFTNPETIFVPDQDLPPGEPSGPDGPAEPYPSPIEVTGRTGTVTDVNVKLDGITHETPDDIAVLLGPHEKQNGEIPKVVLMADSGGRGNYDPENALEDVDLTFDDEATRSLPDNATPDNEPITTGSYKPTQGTASIPGEYSEQSAPQNFPDAPSSPYGSALSDFDGMDPNGTYDLYVYDDNGGSRGQIMDGWSLDITTKETATVVIANTRVIEGNAGANGAKFTVKRKGDTSGASTVNYATSDVSATNADNDYEPRSGTITFAPGQSRKQLKVVVNGDTRDEPNETFKVTLSAPAGATISNGRASGTIVNDDG